MRKSAVSSIFLEEWPKFDHSKIKEDGIRIAVQINGKVRGSFEASVGISEEEVKTKALSMPEIQKWINGAEIKKIIYVKNRLLSIVL
jgi:leucyl-tRNA synthetase